MTGYNWITSLLLTWYISFEHVRNMSTACQLYRTHLQSQTYRSAIEHGQFFLYIPNTSEVLGCHYYCSIYSNRLIQQFMPGRFTPWSSDSFYFHFSNNHFLCWFWTKMSKMFFFKYIYWTNLCNRLIICNINYIRK